MTVLVTLNYANYTPITSVSYFLYTGKCRQEKTSLTQESDFAQVIS